MKQEQPETDGLKGRALDVSGLTDYQDGAVVSRALIQKPTGSVTLFSFAQGQGLSEHTAPFDALVLILDGEAEIRIAGTPRQVKAGQLIIIPAGKPHALQAVKPFKMALVMIRS
jgi:quercetin dioxygenase-like cupin family protein